MSLGRLAVAFIITSGTWGCGTPPASSPGTHATAPTAFSNQGGFASDDNGTQLKSGTWGSDSAALTVTPSSANLKLPCALATFDQVPGTDQDGNFQATGIFKKLSGPVQAGDPRHYTANYSG